MFNLQAKFPEACVIMISYGGEKYQKWSNKMSEAFVLPQKCSQKTANTLNQDDCYKFLFVGA